MQRSQWLWCFLILFPTLVAANSFPQSYVTEVVYSPLPPVQNDVVVSSGYPKCYLMRAGWYHGHFQPTHRVCRYYHTHRMYHRNVYIPGHYECSGYDRYTGMCISTYWVPRHWYR